MSGTVDSGGVVMLGPPRPRHLDQPIAVSLAELVAPINFYRHLEAQLALGFVRGWVKDRYAERGRPAPTRSSSSSCSL
jgi:hypothetical protein